MLVIVNVNNLLFVIRLLLWNTAFTYKTLHQVHALRPLNILLFYLHFIQIKFKILYVKDAFSFLLVFVK